MKNFEMLRYLNRWKYLIVIVAILGCVLVYFYATSNQVYTAETVIRYSNAEAAEGFTPNGSKIDVSEIYSAKVISAVVEELGLKSATDTIRSKCVVTGIVSPDEEERKAAILEKGEEYSYTPTDYSVTFAVSNDYGKNYAKDVLDSIIKNYFISYGEKYINQSPLPNNTANFSESEYDYIENAEILDNAVRDVLGYLEEKQTAYPDFRAAATGYTFQDLYNIYYDILNYDIPHVYTMILQEKTSKDLEVLIKNYENQLGEWERTIVNLEEKIAPLQELIQQYSEKSKEGIDYHFGGNDSESGYILKDVYDNDIVINTETTYDTLINAYVELEIEKECLKVDIERKQEILGMFRGVAATTEADSDNTPSPSGSVSNQDILSELEELSGKLNELYDIITPTVDEFNQYLGAGNITTLTSIRISEKINVKLYLALALFFFLGVGCIGAIVMGRLGDFMEYVLYIDKKTGLPNRAKCDVVIEEYSEGRLPDNFSFVLLRVSGLKNINQKRGRGKGDNLLKIFGALMKESLEKHGFVGYNGGDQFFCFFEDCTDARAEAFVSYFQDSLDDYLIQNPEEDLEYTYAIAETQTTGIYEIRQLMKEAYRKIDAEASAARRQTQTRDQQQ